MTIAGVRRGVAVLAVSLLLGLPASGCDRDDREEVEDNLEELGEEIDEAVDEAEPEIREGLRDAGEAVGKGIEATGEVLQRGGEKLQEEARDTTDSTLPDTVTRDTVILE